MALKNNINTMPKELNAKRQGYMTSWLFIMEKMATLINETIHIVLRCIVHPHDHWNKVVPFYTCGF